MNVFSMEMLLGFTINVISIICTCSTIMYRIKVLEKNVEKHNNLMERLYKVEENTKAVQARMEELKKGINI